MNLAVSNGDKTAIKLRDLLAKQMSPSQVLKAQRLSMKNNKEITQRQGLKIKRYYIEKAE